MSSHSKGQPIHPEFCSTHLRFVLSCSDTTIEAALAELPDYDLGRLRRILRGPLKGVGEPEQKAAG
jgi:ribosomal 50S subunit-associated protein YjgA (DUF615 family)